MINWVGRTIAKFLLSLRYSFEIKGLDEIAARGTSGILFLPNHPAFIDPIIVYTYLHKRFAPHGFADQDQLERPIVGWYAKRWGVRGIPPIGKYGSSGTDEIENVLNESIEGLRQGENLVMWPSGTLYKSRYEQLGANSGVETILKKIPSVRVVLVRTNGLWGSSFSHASGKTPKVGKVLINSIWKFLLNGLIFMPKRRIKLELYEPEDFPRDSGRDEMNRFIENYYNQDAPPNTYVPYYFWQKNEPITVPEPKKNRMKSDTSGVPENTRKIVLDYLREKTGLSRIQDHQHLAADLGLDSLARTDIVLWLEKEFGFAQMDTDAMETVGDVLLGAIGEFVHTGDVELKPVPPNWFRNSETQIARIPEGTTITEVFLKQAAKHPSKAAIADQISGVKTYRDIVTACMVLKPIIEKLKGDYVGLMMPASAGINILYLATLFAGKIPVMVNWTTGSVNIIRTMNLLGVNHIITSKQLVERIKKQGIDLVDIHERFIWIEEFGNQLNWFNKLKCLIHSRLNWSGLRRSPVKETAVILFTSGSETMPKAVPLTHENLLSNVRDALKKITVFEKDSMIGFLPPFHSFGLTGSMLVPVLAGARVVFHPNPIESKTLAHIIDAYGVSVLPGTPTFLYGIVRAANREQMKTLRLAFTGAEKCSEKVYEAMEQICSNAVILEGYGVTECSPIVSLNDENNPKKYTIGSLLDSLESILVDPDTFEPADRTGILLVRGKSIFNGYLNFDGPSPFVTVSGKQWYNTGDLVSVDDDHVFTFRGRLKRFVKLGGEMVSLPAIEAVLIRELSSPDTDGPVFAVEASGSEDKPELVLFSTVDVNRESVNETIRKCGLSGLHSIREVIVLDEIPVLGTGKTDYRSLKKMLKER